MTRGAPPVCYRPVPCSYGLGLYNYERSIPSSAAALSGAGGWSLQAAWKATLKVKCPHCGEVHQISVRERYINGALQDASGRLRGAI